MDRLKNLVLEENASGSFIFSGMDSIGKKQVALWYAMLVNCPEDSPPCGRCISCRKIQKGLHPDVKVITKSEDRKVITIDQARREVMEEAHFKPFEGRFRVFVIDDAHLLNDQAQNALLKVLEEPGPNVIIILVTSRQEDLLPTIRSRCRVFKFQPLRSEVVEQILRMETDLPFDDDRIRLLSLASYGSPGKAIRMASDTDYWKRRNTIFSLLESLPDGKLEDVLDFADSYRVSYSDVGVLESTFEIILSWFRDILILHATGDDSLVLNEDYKNSLYSVAGCYQPSDVVKIQDLVLEIRKLVLENNLNLKMAFQRLFIHIKKTGSVGV